MTSLKVAFLNVRSVLNSFDKLVDFILSGNYDIVAISETWLSAAIPDSKIEISGYEIVRKDRDKRGGGVAFYLKDCFRYEVLLSSMEETIEQIWLKLKYRKTDYILGSLYRPPQKNLHDFIAILEETLVQFLPISSDIIWGGDINIDHLNLGNYNIIKLHEMLDNYGYSQIINTPTRITTHSMTLVDVIFVSSDINSKIVDYGVKDSNSISDHCAVYCEIKATVAETSHNCFRFRNLKRINRDILNELLLVTPFDNVLYIDGIDDKLEHFNGLILGLFDTLAPEKTLKKSKKRNYPGIQILSGF